MSRQIFQIEQSTMIADKVVTYTQAVVTVVSVVTDSCYVYTGSPNQHFR